jgi:1A family penicillin-binding protein
MRIYSYQTPKVNSSNKSPKRGVFKGWGFKFGKFSSRKFWTWAFRSFAFLILLIAVLFLYYSHNLPDPNKLLSRDVPQSTKIYARDGSLLYEIHGEFKRTLVNLDQISPYLKKATVAIEDRNFYNEGGISPSGILRAVFIDVITGQKSQGGSTITQQFVKKAILSDDKSIDRKIREIILAIAIDSRFSKDQVLNFYLNEIPYGRNAYGIEAASQTYFGKSAKDLDLTESAYLAGMPQSPSRYNPSGPNRDLLDTRKNTILSQMRQQGYINVQEEQAAKNEKVTFLDIGNGIKAPHFVLWVEDYLANKYGESTLEQGGLQVYTTLDPKLQTIAENAVKTGIEKESTKYNVNNAALVAIDPKTGQVLAMVGSKNYFGKSEPTGCSPGKNCTYEPNVNVAIAQRQPGSSFKPYVYATAFKKDFGYSPASQLIDVTTNFGTYNGKSYIPHNYNGESYGPVSMRQALAGSLNVPAVKTLDLVGVNNAVQTAHDLGITSPLADCGLSLVLGGCEIRLLDHVAAYSTIANEGIKNPETPILKILDKSGKTLEEFKANSQNVLDPQAAYELISIMTDNGARSYVFGANSPLILPDRTVAAKTGTTQNWHDGWTIGFTPSLSAGVWAGNNDGTLLKKGADGVLVAAPIWHDFMQQALAGTPAESFTVPSGIQHITVDSISGKLPTDLTPSTKNEVFTDYSVPTDSDNVHVKIAVDVATGLPVTATSPSNNISYQTYTVFHSEKPTNPNWEQPVVEWALSHGYSYPPGDSTVISSQPNGGQGLTVNILNPEDGQNISSGQFLVTVSAISPNPISRVDLSIDGQLYQSATIQPFVFNVNKSLADGSHIIAAKAVDSTGASADTSATISIVSSSPLIITQPLDQSLLQFPVTLTASSGKLYNNVNFYYVDQKGTAKLIGSSTNLDHIQNNFNYTMTWQDSPAPGTYKVYAQTPDGVTTKKIQVSIP